MSMIKNSINVRGPSRGKTEKGSMIANFDCQLVGLRNSFQISKAHF